MQLVVFEDAGFMNLLPLVYSRATFNLRCGFDNLLDKIESAMGTAAAALFVRPSLAAVITERQTRPVNKSLTEDDQLWINGRLLLRQKPDLQAGSAAWAGDALLAARMSRAVASRLNVETLLDPTRLRQALSILKPAQLPPESGRLIDYPWQLVQENEAELLRQAGQRQLQVLGQLYPGSHLVSEPAINVGKGSRIKPGAVLDAEAGPIWIGENVVVHPNASVIGPCFIGDGCTIQPGAAIRGPVSLGSACKIGGEVEGTIVHGYSNKQHDGFIGHSYIGEWVNLGASTVNSDLKNTYGPVSVPINGRPVDTGLKFVGSFIGDHTKTGINTALPTGCVIGYACSVFVSRYVPRFVPSFSWLTDEGVERNDPVRALAVAKTVVARRNRGYSPAEEALFRSILDESRRFESPT